MNYKDLSREDFDAMVTGELTHYAIHLEDELAGIICDYFLQGSQRTNDFRRLFLQRDGLTFQDKIDIVRAMVPLFGSNAASTKLNGLLTRVEEFKSWRNVMAHGRDVSDNKPITTLKIQTYSRSGKEKIITITPEIHSQKLEAVGNLLEMLRLARKKLASA